VERRVRAAVARLPFYLEGRIEIPRLAIDRDVERDAVPDVQASGTIRRHQVEAERNASHMTVHRAVFFEKRFDALFGLRRGARNEGHLP
jgi:hypothetical protein